MSRHEPLKQIAQLAGVHRSTVKRYADKGLIQCLRNPVTGWRIFPDIEESARTLRMYLFGTTKLTNEEDDNANNSQDNP